MPRKRRTAARPRQRARLSAVPLVIVALIVAVLAGFAGLAGRAAPAPTESPTAFTPPPALPTPGAIASPDTLHKFAAADESAFITSCVADLPPSSVPQQVAQAFCVCTLNAYEDRYPSYEALNAALASGALDQQTRTQIANGCVQAILGG